MREITDIQRLRTEPTVRKQIACHKSDSRPDHRIADLFAGRSTYIHAVPHKGQRTDERHGDEPSDILHRGFYHRLITGHQFNIRTPQHAVDQGEDRSYSYRPHKEVTHYIIERLCRAHSIIQCVSTAHSKRFPYQRFAGIGKTVHEEGEEHKELHHNAAHRQFGIAVLTRQAGIAHIDDHEAERTDDQVTAQRHQSFDFVPLHRGDDLLETDMNDAVLDTEDTDRQRQSAVLRDEGTVRHAHYAQRRIDSEVITGGHVHDVDQDIDRHRTFRILHADEPALKSKEHQGRGRRPYAHVKIIARHRRHFCRTGHDSQHRRHKQPLDCPDGESRQQRDREALREDLPAFRRSLTTEF